MHDVGTSQPDAQDGHCIASLRCAKVWLAFDPDGAGSTFMSPGTLMQTQVMPALLLFCTLCLASSQCDTFWTCLAKELSAV